MQYLQFDDEEEPTIIASKGEATVHSSASLIKVLIHGICVPFSSYRTVRP